MVPREAPFSEVHLENMLKLTRMGAVIMPASPGFYHKPDSVQDLVDFIVARLLDHLGIAQDLMPRWGEAARRVSVTVRTDAGRRWFWSARLMVFTIE